MTRSRKLTLSVKEFSHLVSESLDFANAMPPPPSLVETAVFSEASQNHRRQPSSFQRIFSRPTPTHEDSPDAEDLNDTPRKMIAWPFSRSPRKNRPTKDEDHATVRTSIILCCLFVLFVQPSPSRKSMTLPSIAPRLRTPLRHLPRGQHQALALWSLPMSGSSSSRHETRMNRSVLLPLPPQQAPCQVPMIHRLTRVIMLLRTHCLQFLATSLLRAFLLVATAAQSNLLRIFHSRPGHLSKVPKPRTPWRTANPRALMKIRRRALSHLPHGWRAPWPTSETNHYSGGGIRSTLRLLCPRGMQTCLRCVLQLVSHPTLLPRLSLAFHFARHPRHRP